jgi:MFS family permease
VKPSAQPYYISVGQIASSAAALFAQFVVVRYVKISSRAMTSIGLAAALVCCLTFLWSANFTVLVAALALQGLGFGLARPGFTTGASLSVAPHEQGAVAGVIGGVSAIGFIGGPLIGWMYEWSPYVPYIFGALLLAALVVYQWLSPTLRSAGIIPPDIEIVEEDVETPVAAG